MPSHNHLACNCCIKNTSEPNAFLLTPFKASIKAERQYRSGLIYSLYQLLDSVKATKLLPYQGKWHSACQTPLTQFWSTTDFQSSVNAMRYQMFKIVARWYLTPQKRKYSNKQAIPLCVEIGTYTHCWVICPRLQPFWDTVLQRIKTTTGCSFPPSVETLLFG